MAFGIGAAMMAASAISAGAQAYGASTAADAQTSAEKAAIAEQNMMYGRAQDTLNPFIQYGTDAMNRLQGLLPGLTAPFQPTMDQLSQTPGYQFALTQGEQAVTNSNAAQGLGTSGAALKGAANYAEGLAGTTFQQQFQNYLNQNQQIANLWGNQIGVGSNAANQLAAGAMGVGANVGSNMVGIGNAQGAAAIGMGSAIGNSAQNGLNQYLNYNQLQRLLDNNNRNSVNNAAPAQAPAQAPAGDAGIGAGMSPLPWGSGALTPAQINGLTP